MFLLHVSSAWPGCLSTSSNAMSSAKPTISLLPTSGRVKNRTMRDSTGDLVPKHSQIRTRSEKYLRTILTTSTTLLTASTVDCAFWKQTCFADTFTSRTFYDPVRFMVKLFMFTKIHCNKMLQLVRCVAAAICAYFTASFCLLHTFQRI